MSASVFRCAQCLSSLHILGAWASFLGLLSSHSGPRYLASIPGTTVTYSGSGRCTVMTGSLWRLRPLIYNRFTLHSTCP